MPDLSVADFIRSAKGEDTLVVKTLANVYLQLLKLPKDHDTWPRLAQVRGYLRNEIALMTIYEQAETQEAFEAIARKNP